MQTRRAAAMHHRMLAKFRVREIYISTNTWIATKSGVSGTFLTFTQPLASCCTNISGAMYRGVPRGGVHTEPQPRPLARGMARSAKPKSLIFADTDTDPAASLAGTHSTCQFVDPSIIQVTGIREHAPRMDTKQRLGSP